MDTSRILQSWHLIESLNPGELPKLDEHLSEHLFIDKKKVSKTVPLDLERLNWNHTEEIGIKKNHQWDFKVYFNIFPKYKMIESFRTYFNSNEEVINKEPNKFYSCSIKVGQNGEFEKESAFIPLLVHVLSNMEKGKAIDYKHLSEIYRSVIADVNEEAQRLFLNGVTKESLDQFIEMLEKDFMFLSDERKIYVELSIFKEGQKPNNLNSTSMYLEDLENLLKEDRLNEALTAFLTGTTERQDIDENRAYLEEVLQPKNLPPARWPSPVEHRLYLMQQSAVNQILNGSQPIHSVNGPPGTGKTTLLKDVIANIIVKRTKEMVKYRDPSEAFIKDRKIQLNNYPLQTYKVSNTLKNYSIVVASSNNGAVENISKELPEKKNMIRFIKSEDKIKTLNDFEQTYRQEAEMLNLFPETSELLIDSNDVWGLFSAALGRSSNIDKYASALFDPTGKNGKTFISQLDSYRKTLKENSWNEAVKEFKDLLADIEQEKAELQEFSQLFYKANRDNNDRDKLEEELTTSKNALLEMDLQIEKLSKEQNVLYKKLDLIPKEGLFQRLLGKETTQKTSIRAGLLNVLEEMEAKEKQKCSLESTVSSLEKKVESLSRKQIVYQQAFSNYKNQGVVLSDDSYWDPGAYAFRQNTTPWLTNDLLLKRGLLFIKALKVHKIFLALNYNQVRSMVRVLFNRKELDLNTKDDLDLMDEMWQTLHFITPVISTTFASAGNMYRGIGSDRIGYLFIDEAGQASPQQAAGVIWRSRQVIAVGDPIQIEPVVTTDKTILADIRKIYQVDEKYAGYSSSVQVLADQANPYGTFKDGNWIGTPLWVHRRCLNPMFTIANKIAYQEKMVLAAETEDNGQGYWLDCKGNAVDKQYVREQGVLVAERVFEHWEKGKSPEVYIITPFTAVKNNLKRVIKERLLKDYEEKEIKEWLKRSVGTVHTFQGKEADVVYFVCGTDENSEGAADWSCSKPNLLNVAVTRAKEKFFVVGDMKRFRDKPYYDTIQSELKEAALSNA
ncbi:AAA domain-containing protein [Metabacillus sp. 84]|uniref:DEAD/DEAH box helicase n=1 Tax=Metabacillus sp. 84 TaxID=3404705 RepID=UPI003CF03D89